MNDFKEYLFFHFYDTTMIIKDFLEDLNKVIIITKPAEFLIYANIVMLASFFAIELDENGQKYTDKKKTENYKLFNDYIRCCMKNKNLKKKFEISSNIEIMDHFQGEIPVVYFSF